MSKKVISQLSAEDRLPCEDGEPMETEYHYSQMVLLKECLQNYFKDQEVYVGANMFVYYSEQQVKNDDFKGPDVFVVLKASKRMRKSWVVWEEGKGPDVVIELLSESTKKNDLLNKKEVYQNKLKVPEYYYFSPLSFEWSGFRLEDGVYVDIEPDDEARLKSGKLGLYFIRWQGVYKGEDWTWMRMSDRFGNLIPTPDEIADRETMRAEEEHELLVLEKQRVEEEHEMYIIEKGRADQASQRAKQADQRAEEERKRAEKLTDKLKDLGVDPDDMDT